LKKIIRTSVLIIFLATLLFVGRSKWIEFRDNADSDRYSQPSYRKATDFSRKVLGMIPRAAARYALADSYLDEGLEDRAVEEYKKTLQMDEHFVPAYVTLGNIYLQRGSYKEALDLIQKAEAVISDNPEIKDLKKRASFGYFIDEGGKVFEQGDRVKARELLNNALKAEPNSAQVYYLLALSFDAQHDFHQVEEYLKKTISLDPEFYLAYSSLGNVYFERGDFEAAIKQYQYFLDAKGDDPSILNSMGLAHMNLERYDLAIPCLQKALAFDPLNTEIRFNLSAVYRDHGMLDKAVEGFNSIIDMKPDYPNVHNDLGGIYQKQGRNQAALKEYRATIEHGQKRLLRNSRDTLLLIELAHAYSEIKEYDKAKKLVDDALLMDPHEQRAYLVLASIYRNSNRPEAALAALDKAEKISPKKYIEEAIADTKKQMARSKY